MASKLPEWVTEELDRREQASQPADIPTCMHGVTSPCGLCGEF